jgi:pimeloyl-ACP methyl ester carboxylesterase
VPADFGPGGLRGLPGGAHRRARSRAAGISWGATVAQELYRHHPELVAILILVDAYVGWKGSLPEEEVRACVEGARHLWRCPDWHKGTAGRAR